MAQSKLTCLCAVIAAVLGCSTDERNVSVTVHSAKVRSSDVFGGSSDCYAEITIEDTKKKTKTINNENHPRWEETFEFSCVSSEAVIQARVLDSDTVGDSDTLVEVEWSTWSFGPPPVKEKIYNKNKADSDYWIIISASFEHGEDSNYDAPNGDFENSISPAPSLAGLVVLSYSYSSSFSFDLGSVDVLSVEPTPEPTKKPVDTKADIDADTKTDTKLGDSDDGRDGSEGSSGEEEGGEGDGGNDSEGVRRAFIAVISFFLVIVCLGASAFAGNQWLKSDSREPRESTSALGAESPSDDDGGASPGELNPLAANRDPRREEAKYMPHEDL